MPLENFQPLHLAPDLKGLKFIHLSNQNWTQYTLDNQSKWPPNGMLDPNIIWDLYKYCERLEKWKDSPLPPFQLFLLQAPLSVLPVPPPNFQVMTSKLLLPIQLVSLPAIGFNPQLSPLAPPVSLSPYPVTGHPSQISLTPAHWQPLTLSLFLPAPPWDLLSTYLLLRGLIQPKFFVGDYWGG